MERLLQELLWNNLYVAISKHEQFIWFMHLKKYWNVGEYLELFKLVILSGILLFNNRRLCIFIHWD